MKFNRIFLVILDSLGVGEAMDANDYSDEGSNTLGHIKDNYDLFIPNLKKLGFLNTINMDENNDVDAYYTVARPNNPGKDTLNGHYEILGVKNDKQFKTFTEHGFPIELLNQIEYITRRKVIGNKNCSGLDIIRELGERQIESGSLIVYTSNGSNLQIAAHENVIPVRNLYEYADKIRQITIKEGWDIGRVIACPFTGNTPRTFKFTNERQDYAITPPNKSVMNSLKDNEYSVISVGKVAEIFNYEGISKIIKARNNIEALNKLEDIIDKNFTGLCVVNLNDFDNYGHKRDLDSYAKAIEELDVEIPMLLNHLNTDDLLILTADHGCDPTFEGYNHTRENVPVIIYGRNLKEPKRLEILDSMADIGATIAENFEVESPIIGTSFLDKLK